MSRANLPILHPKFLACSAAACSLAVLSGGPVLAQEGDQQPAATGRPVQEIIVTARKRQESLLNVPVVETVVSQQQMLKLQTSDMKDLATLVPGLSFSQAVLSIGTQVSLRGVGTSSTDPGVDQSVSLNIDGLSLGQGLAFSGGMFDVGQVEVLKGPQALFFGKSSPGGVISLRTADPTDETEVIARGGYEFAAREKTGEVILSGPVTNTLKMRLAAKYSASDGFYKNVGVAAVGTGAANPKYDRAPHNNEYLIRLTTLWNPTDKFDARLKLNWNHLRSVYNESSQITSCPEGTSGDFGLPFILGSDCSVDRYRHVVDLDPAFFPAGLRNGGVPVVVSNQGYGTLEMNYRPTSDLTLTSVTGYYNLDSWAVFNTTQSTFLGPLFGVSNNPLQRYDITQEVRLNSNFDSPVNFTVGGYFQNARLKDHVVLQGNSFFGLPTYVVNAETRVYIYTYSLFGQLRYQVTPKLELAGGARWTDELRKESATNYITGMPTAVSFNPPGNPRLHSGKIAPEFTITYRPTQDLTVFGAYKRGYKSGSFTIATPPNPDTDNSFGDEKVKGGEAGVKGRLLNGGMVFNIAGYYYKYEDLQVGAVEPPVGGIPIIHTINAATAKIYGVDFDVAYNPAAIEGLSLHGSLNWNHARFGNFTNAPCYGGQTIALGCNEEFNTVTGLYTAQNLSGTRLVRAPDWQATFGFDYEFPVTDNLTLALTSSTLYSSKYVQNLSPRPDNVQDSYFKTDASLALRGKDDAWELALIGKNLNNALTSGLCNNSNLANGVSIPPGGGLQGATTSGPTGLDEVVCYLDRGREVWLRLTLHPLDLLKKG